MLVRVSTVIAAVLVAILSQNVAWAQSAQFELIAKSKPDQWFTTLGGTYVPLGQQAADAPGQPRVNSDYVWSLTDDGSSLWFGTGSGTSQAAVAAALFAIGLFPIPLETKSPGGIPISASEYGSSQYPGLSNGSRLFWGDWRPPKFYQYDPASNQVLDRTPDDPLVMQTLGLRSAGTADGVVLFGGPTLSQTGICLFAFDAATGQFLGSKHEFAYSNIRRWVSTPDGLYTSTLNTLPFFARGTVLRWRGSKASPFRFDTVGWLDNEGGYIAYHDGRLFVSTWPQESTLASLLSSVPSLSQWFTGQTPPCGIWMSPRLDQGGLSWFHTLSWKKVWSATDYEPDPVIAAGYAMGAMSSFEGSLYFGTLHFPTATAAAFKKRYGFTPPLQLGDPQVPLLPTSRTIAILRGQGFGNSLQKPKFELLYGETQLPVFTPTPNTQSGVWSMKANTAGGPPLYGKSGFGNPFNAYLWSSAVHRGKLYLGTYDLGTSLKIPGQLDRLKAGLTLSDPDCGADLWRIDSSSSPAVPVNLQGCGNPASHGIRNLLSTPSGLYLGMANSLNLLTDPNDSLPDGGWELLRLVE